MSEKKRAIIVYPTEDHTQRHVQDAEPAKTPSSSSLTNRLVRRHSFAKLPRDNCHSSLSQHLAGYPSEPEDFNNSDEEDELKYGSYFIPRAVTARMAGDRLQGVTLRESDFEALEVENRSSAGVETTTGDIPYVYTRRPLYPIPEEPEQVPSLIPNFSRKLNDQIIQGASSIPVNQRTYAVQEFLDRHMQLDVEDDVGQVKTRSGRVPLCNAVDEYSSPVVPDYPILTSRRHLEVLWQESDPFKLKSCRFTPEEEIGLAFTTPEVASAPTIQIGEAPAAPQTAPAAQLEIGQPLRTAQGATTTIAPLLLVAQRGHRRQNAILMQPNYPANAPRTHSPIPSPSPSRRQPEVTILVTEVTDLDSD